MRILYVATTTNLGDLTTMEVAHRQVLVSLGHSVTLHLHTDPMPSEWDDIDLVVISRSSQSNQISPKYDSAPVGVTSFDARKFPHSGISTQDFASTGNTRTDYLFESGNSVSGSLGGASHAVYPVTPPSAYAFVREGTQLPAAAVPWMRREGGSDNITGFGIESGSTMADGSTLVGHRVSVIGISDPDNVTSPSILYYINRALYWTAGIALKAIMPVQDIASLNIQDTWAKAHLEEHGYTVTLISHSSDVPSDVNTYHLLVLSNSMQSNMTTKWDTEPIPTLSLSMGKFIHEEVSTQDYSSIGDARLTRYIEPHAAAGSLSGSVTVLATTPDSGYAWLPEASLASGVTIYSRHEAAGSRITGILLEPGASLHNGATSPSRRATLAFHHPAEASVDGVTLLDSLIYWLAAGVADIGPDTEAPSSPANVTASVSTNDISLSWDASTDNIGVSGYEVHRSTVSGFSPDTETLLADITATTYDDDNLANGTYYYKVVAYDVAENKSQPSTEISAVVNYSPPSGGSGPYNILMTVGSESTLTDEDTWILNFLESRSHMVTIVSHSDPVPQNIDTYHLVVHSRSVNQNQIIPKWDNESVPVMTLCMSEFIHTEIADAEFASMGDTRTTAYFYSHPITDPLVGQVVIYDSEPTSGYAWIADSAIPAGVSVLAAHGSDGSRVVAVAAESGAVLDGGIISPSRRVSLPFRQPQNMGTSGEGLLERAIDWAAREIVPDTQAPTAPTGVTTTVTSSAVALTWTASTDNFGVVGYHIHRSQTSGFSPDSDTLIGTVASLYYPDTSLDPGTYYYRVVAYDAAQNTTTSSEVSAQIVAEAEVVGHQWDGLLLRELTLGGEWDGSDLQLLTVGGYWDGSQVVPFGTAQNPGNPDPEDPWVPGAQPTNSNVGLPGIGNPILTSYPANYYGSGTNDVYLENRLIDGDVTFIGNNITLIGCRVTGHISFRGHDILLEDCDLAAASFGGDAKRFTVRRCRITGKVGEDGFHITSNGGSGQRVEDGLIENNFIGNPMLSPGSHYDSIQVRGIDRLTVRGNTIDMGTTFDSRYNATVFLENAQGGNYDVTIQNNWLRSGGYYNLRLYGYNQQVIDNVFYRVPDAVPVIGNSYSYTASGNTWDDGTSLAL